MLIGVEKRKLTGVTFSSLQRSVEDAGEYVSLVLDNLWHRSKFSTQFSFWGEFRIFLDGFNRRV